MTDFPNGIVLEARKKRLTQSRDKNGDWHDVTFQIHPDDASSALTNMPLGTRVALVVTPLGDTEQPPAEQTEERPKGGPICKRAVLLCKRPEFQQWIAYHAEHGGWIPISPDDVKRPVTEEGAKEYLCRACGIESRTELDHSFEARKRFIDIESDFYDAQRGGGEAARLAQRDRT